MSQTQVRKVTSQDIMAWAEMRNQLWPDKLSTHIKEIEAYFAGVSIDVVETFVIETAESSMVAFIELNIRNFAEGSHHGQVPYVEGWYVKPEYQNKGLGKQLMQQAETWAIQQGFTELASDTEIDNDKSQAIHKRLGFKEVERVVSFLKPLK
jgi:aminoglycoside 6'-N-acetyltransferase I